MSKPGSFLLILLLSLVASAQNRGFKEFYLKGTEQVKSGDHAGAVKNLEEAFRLEQKAQKFKTEGNFFENYLPRYQIALAYEALDVLQASEWATKSKEALESDVIRKRKNDLAAYHADLGRIEKAAKSFLAERRQAYDRELAGARSLVNANRFAEARTALEKVVAMDPTRLEGQTELNGLSGKRNTYLKGLGFEVEKATLKQEWKQAERVLAQMKAVDAGFPAIRTLTAGLEDAREEARQALLAKEAAARVVKTPPPKPKETTRTENTRATPDPRVAERKREAARKAEVRKALLASLTQYRKGYADKALSALRKIPEERGATYSSYHWLKGVYLLTTYQQSESGDEALKTEAGEAMAQVARLQPGFQPDGRLYPAFILDFYKARHP